MFSCLHEKIRQIPVSRHANRPTGCGRAGSARRGSAPRSACAGLRVRPAALRSHTCAGRHRDRGVQHAKGVQFCRGWQWCMWSHIGLHFERCWAAAGIKDTLRVYRLEGGRAAPIANSPEHLSWSRAVHTHQIYHHGFCCACECGHARTQ